MTDPKALPPENTDRPAKNGGRLRSGNPGNKGGGDKPKTYKMWLAHLLTSEKHRKEFTKVIEDGDHPAFKFATEHAAAYAEGKPTQKIEADVKGSITVTHGLGLKK